MHVQQKCNDNSECRTIATEKSDTSRDDQTNTLVPRIQNRKNKDKINGDTQSNQTCSRFTPAVGFSSLKILELSQFRWQPKVISNCAFEYKLKKK